MLQLNSKIAAWNGNIQGLEKKGDTDRFLVDDR